MTFSASPKTCACGGAAVTRLMLGGARSWTWVCARCRAAEFVARTGGNPRCEGHPTGPRCRARSTTRVVPFGSRAYWLCADCAELDRAARTRARSTAEPLALAFPDEAPAVRAACDVARDRPLDAPPWVGRMLAATGGLLPPPAREARMPAPPEPEELPMSWSMYATGTKEGVIRQLTAAKIYGTPPADEQAVFDATKVDLIKHIGLLAEPNDPTQFLCLVDVGANGHGTSLNGYKVEMKFVAK